MGAKVIMIRPLLICAIVGGTLSGCALPTPVDADKTACVTTDDCRRHRVCLDGVCALPNEPPAELGVTSCPETPCVAPASCFLGFCAERLSEPASCEAYAELDGCPANALCYDLDFEVAVCEQLPACSATRPCPVGPVGALCNLGIVASKEAICMPRYCQTAANCPEAWHCVRYVGSEPVGFCSGGTPGEPCASANDCHSQSCEPLFRVCR